MSKKSKWRKKQLQKGMKVTTLNNATVQTNYVPRPSCHVGPMKVMQIGNVNVWAGSYKEIDGDWNWDLMLRFGDERSWFSNPNSVTPNAEAKFLFKNETILEGDELNPAVLDIHWPDFDQPRLGKVWWKALYDEVKSWPEGDMVLHCVGGHGRTGTALAILAAFNGEQEPIAFIRKVYCKSSVESDTQVNYINAITGLNLSDKPVGFWGPYFGTSGAAAMPIAKDTEPKNWTPTYPHYDPKAGHFYKLYESQGIIYREYSDGTLVAETEAYMLEDNQDWSGPAHRASVS